VAPNAFSGAIRKARHQGGRAGQRGFVSRETNLHRAEIAIRRLQPGAARGVREDHAGRRAWVCRSANAAMWALSKSGVKIVHEDGMIERWRSPRLPAWEVPRRDPAERRQLAPDVAAQ